MAMNVRSSPLESASTIEDNGTHVMFVRYVPLIQQTENAMSLFSHVAVGRTRRLPMRNIMRNVFVVAITAAALAAGVVAVSAQGAGGDQRGTRSGGAHTQTTAPRHGGGGGGGAVTQRSTGGGGGAAQLAGGRPEGTRSP